MTPPLFDGAPVNVNPTQRFGFLALLLFLFLLFSRLIDFIPIPKLQLLLSLLMLLATVLTGTLLRGLTSLQGKLITAFTGWLIICIPFSVWPGGSVHLVMEDWMRSYAVFLMLSGLLVSITDCRRAMQTLAAASFTIAVLGMLIGQPDRTGRLIIGSGTLSNSNDLAQFLLVGLPFWFIAPQKKSPFFAVFRWGVAALIVLVVLKTGSRSALLAVIAMVLMALWRAPLMTKAGALLLGVVLLPGVIAITPAELRSRYLTSLAGSDDIGSEGLSSNDVSAIRSKEQRLFMLTQSLWLTVRNPIFGVGPGQFQVAVSRKMEDEGQRGVWLETHNAYTQVSSETGFPGFFLYFSAVGLAFLAVRKVDKAAGSLPQLQPLRNMAFCLTMSVSGFLVTSIFSSIAYHAQVLVLIALSTVFAAGGMAQIARVKGIRPRPVAVPKQAPYRPPMPVAAHPTSSV